MEKFAAREYWIPKIPTIFGMLAGICNFWALDLGYGYHFSVANPVMTLVYMLLVILAAWYSIRKELLGSLTTAALHWSAALLLTLPAVLSHFGLLTLDPTGSYLLLLLTPLNAALFGVGWLFDGSTLELALYAFPLLFAAVMLAFIGWGAYHINR